MTYSEDTICIFTHPGTVHVIHRPWQLPLELLEKAEVRPLKGEDIFLALLRDPEEIAGRNVRIVVAILHVILAADNKSAVTAQSLQFLLPLGQEARLRPKLRQLIKEFQQEDLS